MTINNKITEIMSKYKNADQFTENITVRELKEIHNQLIKDLLESLGFQVKSLYDVKEKQLKTSLLVDMIVDVEYMLYLRGHKLCLAWAMSNCDKNDTKKRS